jgi:predicted kinase
MAMAMELVLFMGAQAAGKSTFYAARFAQTHLRLSLDMLRTRHREQRLVAACLEARQSVVIDNTNPTRAERAVYLDAAKAHGFRVTGYRFEAPYAQLLARNAQRSGRARVPEVAIRATLARFEPPTLDEGFDALWQVVPDAAGTGFEVRPWPPHPGHQDHQDHRGGDAP